ncbi:Molybdopterin-guanine dinucleotide biosynthesis protein A [Georgenia satyanarayanai]|uniref:Molybdopterin-guanine dinucleotide biosynthesis protein A n=1 Tax=Georgenia satyanarayanai TaxID=860221 RepID=A0A2Y9C4A3_9MICO|nr:NTP transferase domain-containing protein [Georgenia satyanarayanai]PYG01024.1 molybdopterin-guanine dinucleotide biosynthesis protein A [Georgenia satyanarayanai]SSA39263.1 Molybdopterin-guanine dinucleotide biosynthesis protein A [Georgenia satyanarayanai]
MALDHDAVVLAGGTGRRLGGALKPQVEVLGRRLLDHVLDATGDASRVVVVAPEAVPVPDGVARTLEDPPHGGPVAGIVAGLRALGSGAPLVLLLACDLPGASAAVPRLLAAAEESGATDADGLVLSDDGGREQWLLGLYVRSALEAAVASVAAAGGVRGAPVRDLVAPLRLLAIPAATGEVRDIDTWADRDDYLRENTGTNTTGHPDE